ncbi:hypothetical protein BGZ65_004773 [Modicella reniformis]|uniref:gamma-glutamylcyclotransferase n=1 Tax=Modicella reniformis TaxID=1440133 RepID=A0A9P6IYQ4_9FUNG|nr:hypothetical protein BGZ65_004773 [Modicella reniformis]
MACAAGDTTASCPDPRSKDDTQTLWYLAYGSNMNPKVFTDWRKIQPLESKAVVVPDYWLSFDLCGVPFLEPCFASILKKDTSRLRDKSYAVFVHERCCYGRKFVWDEKNPEEHSYPPMLHGVAHKITQRDWDLVVQSEGGWGHDVPTGYDHILVNCKVVNSNEQITAHVLAARPKALTTRSQPSLRYKNVLTAGAAHHNLDPAYQDYLATIIPYRCKGLRSRLASLLFMIFNVPQLIAFAFILRRNRGKPAPECTQPPFWMAWYYDKASRFSNSAHDYIVAPILGSGKSSSQPEEARKETNYVLEQVTTREEYQATCEKEAEKEPSVMKAVEKMVETLAE